MLNVIFSTTAMTKRTKKVVNKVFNNNKKISKIFYKFKKKQINITK